MTVFQKRITIPRMDTNDTRVTLTDPERSTGLAPARYADEAMALLAHVDAVEDEIGALLGDSERSLNARLADRKTEIGVSIKRAEIYATLAVAEAVTDLRRALRGPRVVNYPNPGNFPVPGPRMDGGL